MVSIGIDVGGTFTDLVAYDRATGQYRVHKLRSVPANPMVAMVIGLAEMGISASEVEVFAHGTTVTTNAVIQKQGAKTALITTLGFRDILQLRRTNRAEVYNLQWTPPEELVPRNLRGEVNERTDAEGRVLRAVDPDEVRHLVQSFVDQEVEAVAVVFLHSYLNPANERVVRDLIHAEFPGLAVCASADILPEWREFERTSTTVVNAYLVPIISRYLRALTERLSLDGYDNEVFVMLSNGGLSTAQVACDIPAYTLASGPAGGVIAETSIAKLCGEKNVVGLDIGGTSADVSLVRDGKPILTADQQVEFGAPVRLPAIEVVSIGAGGGSLAWLDQAGGLHVGPLSAGADPGPAFYGRDGKKPTVTDAHAVLGRLNPRFLLGGKMPVHLELAQASMRQYIAEPLKLSLAEASWGILEIVNQNMINAIRQVTIQRGIDPREFTLFGYGGAGPLHASQIAQELGMPRVIIPANPGVTSALGLLMADIRHDFCRTFLRVLRVEECGALRQEFAELATQGRNRLAKEKVGNEAMRLVRSFDLRYLGQTHDLTVELPCEDLQGSELVSATEKAFQERHQQEFGFAKPLTFPLEVVNIRLTAIGMLPKANPVPENRLRQQTWILVETRPVLFNLRQGYLETPIFARDDIPSGVPFVGPAIIEQFDSTTVVLPGQRVVLEQNGNLTLWIRDKEIGYAHVR